jgi:hypothetical protein
MALAEKITAVPGNSSFFIACTPVKPANAYALVTRHAVVSEQRTWCVTPDVGIHISLTVVRGANKSDAGSHVRLLFTLRVPHIPT